jgi:membrane protein
MFNAVRRLWAYGKRISDAYARHFSSLMAAAVSFYVILSSVPLLSVGVAVLGIVLGGSQNAIVHVKEVLQDYLPSSGGVIFDTLSEIKRDRGILGFVGVIGLLISGSAIFTNLEIAFNNIWGVTRMRSWLKQRLVALGTTIIALLLMFSSLAITALLTYIQNRHIPGTGFQADKIPYLWELLGRFVPFVLTTFTFALIYKIVPNKPILWREAWIGAAFGGTAFEIAKYLFSTYLTRFSTYNKVYGSLGGLIILVVWTYYSMTILFIGAEIAADHGTKLPAADEKPTHIPCPPPVENEESIADGDAPVTLS